MNEAPRDFRCNDIKVMKSGEGRTKEITYKVQYNSISKAFKACGISSLKKTHVGRGCGVRHAEAGGASAATVPKYGSISFL